MQRSMEIGQLILGRYEVTALLSSGGQGETARALDHSTGQEVCIKHLLATSADSTYLEALASFKREGAIRIGHKNVVDPIAMDQENGEWFIIFPFIDGSTLREFIHLHGRVTIDEGVRIVTSIAEGLDAIHTMGVVHRDIKPENILIDPQGTPHIIDLGIGKDVRGATIAGKDGMIGTLESMSPEQVACPSRVDYRCDLYALGALAFYIFSGQGMLQGVTPAEIAVEICQRPAPLLAQFVPEIPAAVAGAVAKLLAKNPDDRFPSARAFIEAIEDKSLISGNGSCCPVCGTDSSVISALGVSKYCHRCGTALQPGQISVAICLACGTAVGNSIICLGCRRSFGKTDHRLFFRSGTAVGKIFRAPEGQYEVGRIQISSQDPLISRRHAWFNCVNGTLHVQDAGSINKTYVGGRLATAPIRLQSHDEIYVGGNSAIYTVNP